MSYGENYGTNTLAKALMNLAIDIYHDLDDGKPWDEVRDDVRRLMQGAMELWMRMVMEDD
jgi:hypothetical protein